MLASTARSLINSFNPLIMSANFLPLQISEYALKDMELHAGATFPNECCGFFYGEEKDGSRVISHTLRIDNSKEGDQRRRFAVSSKDYMQAERYALKNGLTLLGVYHSHPLHPAIPSEHDLKVAMPWFSYIIVSVGEQGVDHTRSWQLNDERQFEEENILND